MKSYTDATYGERIAEVYDEIYSGCEEGLIDLLCELAGGGRVLELGIGTGRIALPLIKRGLDVSGIDVSASMIDRLRAKPGAEDIRVAQGSFAGFPAELDDERFDLIFVVFNTFFGLLTQEEQLECFRSVAAHLAEEGRFLIEVFVPDLTRFEDGQAVRLQHLAEDSVRLDAAELDLHNQQIASQHIRISSDSVELYPVKLRYAWPSELDLMAQLAGLALQHRWASWQRDPFTKESTKHISVYGETG